MSKLALDELSFRWADAGSPLFPPISHTFASGTIATVMGENGCGKTTLIEIIGGRRNATSGLVTLDEGPISSNQFNYLPQDHARLLFPHLTIRENIALRRNGPGALDNARELAFVEALFPQPSALGRFPPKCSGGQRQRAALCRAVMEIPSFPVTLLDEPFSQLSREAKVAVLPVIRDRVRSSHNIAVVVTHDLLDAVLLGDALLTLSANAVGIYDTSAVRTEDDFWEAARLREEILRATHSAKNQ